jgi:hypothetical protein
MSKVIEEVAVPAPDVDWNHPSLERLEAFAAGDADAGVRGHLASCASCTQYVAAIEAEGRAFRERPGANGPLQRALAAAPEGGRAWSSVRGLALGSALLAAAAVVLFVGVRPHPPRADLPHAEPEPAFSGEMRFKGELSVAVIRERGGRQERLVGPFGVRPSDAVRVEVSVDRAGPLTAGLLTDAGEWIVLLAPGRLEPGTHYSEEQARFDGSPTRATLLVGAPAGVERARRTRDFAGLIAWRVTSDP